MQAAALVSYDGWHAWRVPRLGGAQLAELRESYQMSSVEDREGVSLPKTQCSPATRIFAKPETLRGEAASRRPKRCRARPEI